VKAARSELAAAFLDDQLRDAKKKLDVAARASGTTLAGLFGVGPVAAAAVIGDVGDVSRLHGRDLFAATFSRTALVRRPAPHTRQEGTADR
jgi:transposase